MKKLLILLMLAVSLTALADNAVSLSAASGRPGDEVTITLSLSNSDAVTALEAWIPLGDDLTLVAGSCVLNTARSNGHMVSAAVVDKVLKIYAYSLGNAAFKGNSGALLTFKLRVGNEPGTFTLTPAVVLSNAAGAQLASTASSGSVYTLAPKLAVNTTEIDYGHVPIRSTYTSYVSLANTGTTPLTVSAIYTTDSELTVSAASMTIAAGSSQTFTVTYSPQKRVPFEAKVMFESNAVNAKIYGKWQSVAVKADPYSVNELRMLPAQGVADTEVTVVLNMNNMEPIVAMQAKIWLPEGIEYVAGSAKMLGRSNGHEVNASMVDGYLQILSYNGTNTPYTGNNGDLLSFDVKLGNGTGWYWITPENVILANAEQENMTSAVYGDCIIVQSPTIIGDDNLTFGEQPVTEPLTVQYQVRNTGEAPLTVDRVTFFAEGYSVTTELPLTIDPYQTASLDVTYTTDVVGPFSTTMNVYSNDPQCRMKSVAVSGRAYSPNALAVTGKCEREKGYVLDVALDNYAQISAVQFDVKVSDTSFLEGDMTVTLTDRLQGFMQSSSKMGDGWYRVVAFNMDNKSIPDNEGTIMTLCLPTKVEPDKTVRFDIDQIVLSTPSGENVVSPDASFLSIDATRFFVPGDVNNDGRYSIADVSLDVEFALGRTPAQGIVEAADANSDGNVTSADVSIIVSYVLDDKEIEGNASGAALIKGAMLEPSYDRLTYYCIEATWAKLGLTNAANYAAAQFDLVLPQDVTVADVRMASQNGSHQVSFREQKDGRVRVLVFSPANTTFADGQSLIEIQLNGFTEGEIEVTNASVVRKDGDNISEQAADGCVISNASSAVAGISADALKVGAEGRNIVIIAPQSATVILSDITGRSTTISVEPGRNVIPVAAGIYFVNTKKIVIR